MTGSDRAQPVRGWLILLVVALTSPSCTEFPRTNPLDPSASLTLTVSGPDSATAVGDTVSFEVRSAKGEILNQLAIWQAPDFLSPLDGRGRFVANSSVNAVRLTGSVKASVGANTAAKPFVLNRKPAKLVITDCFGRTTTTLTFVALAPPSRPADGKLPVCTTLIDRNGIPVPDPAVATAVIRDQAVVRFVGSGQSELNAYAIGSTYVVYSRAGLTDSILVTVRQDPASFAVDPPACRTSGGVRLAVGQSLQLSALPPVLDANGNVITDPVGLQSALLSIRWRATFPLDAVVTVSGLVTGHALSSGYVMGELSQGGSVRDVAYCYVMVY